MAQAYKRWMLEDVNFKGFASILVPARGLQSTKAAKLGSGERGR
jgi:hypothetical protein